MTIAYIYNFWIKLKPIYVVRIIISEDYTINGKKCLLKFANGSELVKDGHRMDHATCFQYYNPKILDYISTRI